MEDFHNQYVNRFQLLMKTSFKFDGVGVGGDGGAPFVTPNFTCIVPDLYVGGVTVYQPALIPFTFLGMFVGLFCAHQIHHQMKHLRGASIYSLMFLAFFGMNFTGLFSNCLFPSGWISHNNGSLIGVLLALADAFFSSCVNAAFAICILVDLGLLKEKSPLFKLVVTAISVGIAYGYYETFYGQWEGGFTFLYKTLAEIGFVVFFVGSLIFLLIHRKVFWVGLGGLGLALVNGLLGFKSLELGDWFCNHISLWVGVGPVWFFFSATSLFSLFVYFILTGGARSEDAQSGLDVNTLHVSDSEKVVLLQSI